MLFPRGVSQTLTLSGFNTYGYLADNIPSPQALVVADGVAFTPSNSLVWDSSNAGWGVYNITLLASEMNGVANRVIGKTATLGYSFTPVLFSTYPQNMIVLAAQTVGTTPNEGSAIEAKVDYALPTTTFLINGLDTTGLTQAVFTIKSQTSLPDELSLFAVKVTISPVSTDGLFIQNGAALLPPVINTDANLFVNSTTGSTQLTLNANARAMMLCPGNYIWELSLYVSGNKISTNLSGNMILDAAVRQNVNQS